MNKQCPVCGFDCRGAHGHGGHPGDPEFEGFWVILVAIMLVVFFVLLLL